LLRPLRARNPSCLPLARLPGRPRLLSFVAGAGNACVASLLAQSVLGAFGFGSSLA